MFFFRVGTSDVNNYLQKKANHVVFNDKEVNEKYVVWVCYLTQIKKKETGSISIIHMKVNTLKESILLYRIKS